MMAFLNIKTMDANMVFMFIDLKYLIFITRIKAFFEINCHNICKSDVLMPHKIKTFTINT